MRAAELIAPRTFQLTDRPIADPAPGEVQVRIKSVGICGSDLHAYSDGMVGSMANAYPMVLGHEPAGVIVKTGTGVTGLEVGDRSALEPALYCYHCEFCQSGHHNVCAKLRFLSSPQDPGFFREIINLPAVNIRRIPPAMGFDEATLAEPLAVAMHSIRLASVCAGETVTVIGAGPIGLLTIAAARAIGAKHIWAVEPLAHRRELALGVGAEAAFEPDEAVGAIVAATGGRCVDCVIDCAAQEHTMEQAVELTRNAGRVALTGIHSVSRFVLDGSAMRRKELTLFNVRRSNHETSEAVALIHAHPSWFGSLITHTRTMEEIGEAFAITSQYSDGVGKMIVRP